MMAMETNTKLWLGGYETAIEWSGGEAMRGAKSALRTAIESSKEIREPHPDSEPRRIF